MINIFKQKYNKVTNEVCNINDASCGYSTLLDTVHNIHYIKPILAIKMLNIINMAINDTNNFIQDSNTTNRTIIECIKTNNVNLLSKQYFRPIIMPTYAIKSLFSVLDEFGNNMLIHLLNGNVYGKVALIFEKAMNSINDFMTNYLIILGIINNSYNEDSCVNASNVNLPYYSEMFKKCESGNRWYGFQLLYNIWHLSKHPTAMSFDILIRYLIIGLYLKQHKFTKVNLTNLPIQPNIPKILISYVPKIKIEPFYKNEFRKLSALNNKLTRMVSGNV